MPFSISVHYFSACALNTCTDPLTCCFTLGAHLQELNLNDLVIISFLKHLGYCPEKMASLGTNSWLLLGFTEAY